MASATIEDDSAIGSPMGFLSAASGGQLLGQAVLTGGPVVVALSGGTEADVTVLFVALALYRAPYTLSLGALSQLTGILTNLVVTNDQRRLRRFRRLVLAGTALAVVLAASLGRWLGPGLIHFMFGSDVDVTERVSVVIAVASAVSIAGLVVTIAVLAQGRSLAVVWSWLVAILVAGVTLAAANREMTHLEATCWAFLVAEVVAFGCLLVAEMNGAARLVQLNTASAARRARH
jgi:hypothetical protein